MALNKKIISMVREKTKSDVELGNFLVELLEYESENPGWYTTAYATILENNCKEDNKNADN